MIEAIKEWFISLFESKVCLVCEELREQLEYERSQVKYLQTILFTNARITVPEVQEESTSVDFKLLRPRRQSWSAKRKEVEKQHRVESSPKLDNAEKLFEESLKKNASN
jgi:hypothetical protein